MRFNLLGKLFSTIFVIAIFFSVFHNHNDLKPHNNCQICTIQSNISNIDTPSVNIYLSDIELFSQGIISKFPILHKCCRPISLKARAPPFIS